MTSTARARTKTESIVGAIILLALAGIAAGVLLKQSRYDRAIFLPAATSLLPAPETFDAETLSDKIDGKAEFYLAAGFVSLQCQRFSQAGNPDAWMEVFLYDMGHTHNAFAVWSAQRRANAMKLDLGRFAYRTANALFFVRGRYYVEIVASLPDEKLLAQALAFAGNLAGNLPAAEESPPELALLPTENMVADSAVFLPADVFGFDRLNRVMTAKYRIGGQELTGFVSLRATANEAAALADAYRQFLSDVGAADAGEIVFSQGRALAGVHQAKSKDAAELLAGLLRRKLAEAAP
jgi:hypothetical protein